MIKKIKEFFKGEKGTARGLIIGITLIVVAGLIEFLFNKGNNLFTGWQILKNQTFGEWFRMFFFTILAAGTFYAFLKYYKKEQDTRGIKVFVFALMAFVAIAFGKACTDKANDGVTSGKGRPVKVEQKDDGRVPAEDLLKK